MRCKAGRSSLVKANEGSTVCPLCYCSYVKSHYARSLFTHFFLTSSLLSARFNKLKLRQWRYKELWFVSCTGLDPVSHSSTRVHTCQNMSSPSKSRLLCLTLLTLRFIPYSWGVNISLISIWRKREACSREDYIHDYHSSFEISGDVNMTRSCNHVTRNDNVWYKLKMEKEQKT